MAINVVVQASDPVDAAGVVALLGDSAALKVVPPDGTDEADVVVVVQELEQGRGLLFVREAMNVRDVPVVLVATNLVESQLVDAVGCGVVAVVLRAELDAAALPRVVVNAAEGRPEFPADLMTAVVEKFRHLQRDVPGPGGLGLAGLTDQEVQVLRMLGNGLDSAMIARYLQVSESTVKNVIKRVVLKFNRRNRTQAVVHAARAGII